MLSRAEAEGGWRDWPNRSDHGLRAFDEHQTKAIGLAGAEAIAERAQELIRIIQAEHTVEIQAPEADHRTLAMCHLMLVVAVDTRSTGHQLCARLVQLPLDPGKTLLGD